MPHVVTQNAMIRCNQGLAPASLLVTSQAAVKILGNPVATIMDVQPVINIPPFGNCRILTAAAMGVATPCVPAPTGTWEPGSNLQWINGLPVLEEKSKCQCGVGGQITIDFAGQALANES